jgi:hypothetical protein
VEGGALEVVGSCAAAEGDEALTEGDDFPGLEAADALLLHHQLHELVV